MDEGNQHRGWDVWMENGSVGMHIINQWPENAIKAVSTNRLTASRWQHVTVSYDGKSNVDGIKIYIDGKESGKNVTAKSLTETIKTTVPFTVGRRSSGAAATNSQIQDVRIYKKALAAEEASQIADLPRRQYLLGKQARTPEETEELYSWYLKTMDTEHVRLNDEAQKLIAENNNILKRFSPR
jgi:hypothetical protein